ncbi:MULTISPECIES: 30S ribosomal protein S20 [Caldisericum]|jgi:small subunit ribosomal protein S20|uniref:Small ribosomal subunit protein bS20 n=1 Tax=Caldisericum exile TaxID=693075 RepID=A0A2J6X9C6_9BACT|nr:MAG: 30S ribosomal protein S20 [Caldisericum exile]
MPILKASKKSVRKDEKRRERNEYYRVALKRALDFAKKSGYAEEKVREAIKIIDKLEAKGILHANTAARKKSRLMAKFNQAKNQEATA